MKRKNIHAVALGRRGGSADSDAQRAHRASPKAGAGRPRMHPPRVPVLHLAARYTFKQDGLAACNTRAIDHDHLAPVKATHTLSAVTCASCRRTLEFRRAAGLGLLENDQHWEWS